MIRHLTMPLATKKHFIKSLSLLDTDLHDFKTKFKKSQNTINEDRSADKPKAKIDAKRVIEIWRRAIFRKDSLEETVKKAKEKFLQLKEHNLAPPNPSIVKKSTNESLQDSQFDRYSRASSIVSFSSEKMSYKDLTRTLLRRRFGLS